MKLRVLSLLSLTLLAACGSDETTQSAEVRVLPQLSQQQKQEFMDAVMAESRVSTATGALFDNGRVGTLELPAFPEDPVTAEMTRLLRASCQAIASDSSSPNGSNTKAQSLVGEKCPVSFSKTETTVAQPGSKSGTMNGALAYLASSEEFRVLNDVTAINGQSNGVAELTGDEKNFSVSANVNGANQLQSRRYGNLRSTQTGAVNLRAENGKLTYMYMDITYGLNLPSFPGELRVMMTIQGEQLTLRLWVNGEEIPANGIGGQRPRGLVNLLATQAMQQLQ